MLVLDHDRATLWHGAMQELLAKLPENSVDSCVCDPPYELGFMGKAWDSSGVAFDPKTWAAVLRVLKPGGHLIAFAGTRTYHRIACAIEDAGFEVRDMGEWIYGTGFPKSLDVSKAIDKRAGHWRGRAGAVVSGNGSMTAPNYERTPKGDPVTAAAAAWEGFGTALKPAQEPWCLARKPLEGTVRDNVLKWGCGALNIGGCRVDGVKGVPASPRRADDSPSHLGSMSKDPGTGSGWDPNVGRWPANLILDEDLDLEFARFFYCAKASRSEREYGCEGLPAKSGGEVVDRDEGSAGIQNPRAGAGRTAHMVDEELIVEVLWGNDVRRATLLVDTVASQPRVTGVSGALKLDASGWNTILFGKHTTGPFRQGSTSTIATKISSTTQSKILSLLRSSCTSAFTEAALSTPTVAGKSPVENADEFGLLSLITSELTASLLGAENAASAALLRIRGSGQHVQRGIRNTHATVKPIALMQYLVRLVTPPSGLVLDPFTGSGTTGIAAVREGFQFLGAEMMADHAAIARARITKALKDLR